MGEEYLCGSLSSTLKGMEPTRSDQQITTVGSGHYRAKIKET